MKDARQLYYQSPGTYSAIGVFVAMAAGIVASAVAGSAYAYVLASFDVSIYRAAIFTGIFGLSCGASTDYTLRFMKVENARLSILAIVVATSVGYYLSWIAWLHVATDHANEGVDVLTLLTSPGVVWDLIRAFNETGTWEVLGYVPSGWMLWAIWAGEFLVVFASALVLWLWHRKPFCEQCRNWCEEEADLGRFHARALAPKPLKARLESGDLAALTTLGPARSCRSYYKVGLHSCACRETNMLTIYFVRSSLDTSSRGVVDRGWPVEHLLVTHSDVRELRVIKKRFAREV